MGRLLLFIGLAWSLIFFLDGLLAGEMTGIVSVWVEMLSSFLGYSAFVALALIPVWFPHGSPSHRLRSVPEPCPTGRLGRGCSRRAHQPRSQGDHRSGEPAGPTAGLSGFSSFMLDQGFFLIPLLLLVALGSLVRRWRTSSGVERLQYPWLMTAIGFVIVILVTTQLVSESVILDVSLVFSRPERHTSRHRRRHPPLPALRHRQAHQPHRLIRARGGGAGRGVCGFDPGPRVPGWARQPPGRCGSHARLGGTLHPGAAPGPAFRRSSFRPVQV